MDKNLREKETSLPLSLPPRFYGRRRGRTLKGIKQHLWDTWHSAVTFSLPPSHQAVNLAELFMTDPYSGALQQTPSEFWLEIGFGGGEHLNMQACRNPQIGFIGCEVFLNGLANAIAQMYQNQTSNLRIFPHDIRLLLPLLPEASLSRIFILFPDPWPKARHHKRRLITANFINTLARILRTGGELRLATDDASYAEDMQRAVVGNKSFSSSGSPPHIAPADWVPTRYEQRGKQAGRLCYYFSYTRQNDV